MKHWVSYVSMVFVVFVASSYATPPSVPAHLVVQTHESVDSPRQAIALVTKQKDVIASDLTITTARHDFSSKVLLYEYAIAESLKPDDFSKHTLPESSAWYVVEIPIINKDQKYTVLTAPAERIVTYTAYGYDIIKNPSTGKVEFSRRSNTLPPSRYVERVPIQFEHKISTGVTTAGSMEHGLVRDSDGKMVAQYDIDSESPQAPDELRLYVNASGDVYW